MITIPPNTPTLENVFIFLSSKLYLFQTKMASGQRPGGQQTKVCQFKLVLLGESAVGKSSLVLRFVKGQFHEFQADSHIQSKYTLSPV